MTRIPFVDPSNLDPQQKTLYDAIASTRKGVRPPLAIWLHHPAMADPIEKLGYYCRHSTCLPARLSELAMILMGKIWHAEYMWVSHKPHALKGGLAPDIIESIRIGERPKFTQADEAAVYDFVTILHETREMPEDVYERAVAAIGRSGVLDLTGILGLFTLSAMNLKVFDVSLLPGQEPDLPPK